MTIKPLAMKSILTFIFILVVTYLHSQNSFSAAYATRFIDIPGPQFYGSIKQNNTIIIYEYNDNGTVTWQDTIHSTVPNENLYQYDIHPFPNSPEFAVILQSSYNSSFASDTTRIIQTYKLNYSTKQITGGSIDTLSTFQYISLFASGTSTNNQPNNIQLFVPRQKLTYLGLVSRSLEPWIIDDNLSYSQICSSDSVIIQNTNRNRLSYVNDTLLRIEVLPSTILRERYSSDFTNINPLLNQPLNNVNSEYFNVLYGNRISSDSILVVIFEKYSGANNASFHFYLFTADLELINEKTVPIGNDYNSTIVVHSNLIYHCPTLSLTQNITASANIRVFDMNFDEVCEFPTGTIVNNSYGVSIINDQVYFNQKNGISIIHFAVNNCELSLSIDESEIPEFKTYPNPTNQLLTIEFNHPNSKKQLIIYNLFGESLLNEIPSQQLKTLDLSNLASGTYILRIIEDNQIATQKINKL